MIINETKLSSVGPRPTLTLVRGLPGSGKSTLAAQLAQQTGAIHLETDMYFVNAKGHYRFDAKKLSDAHEWCQQQTRQHLTQGFSVIVSNTFVCLWEMKVYQELAQQLNITIEIQVCRGEFGTVHNIDASVLANMKRKWEES
nr:ATP-binding protein [Vibrio sp. S11_S32]